MLAVHARDAIQEVSLQAQGDGGAGGLLDGIAGAGDVDVLDGLAVYFAAGRVVAEVGDEPVALWHCLSAFCFAKST